MLTEAGQNNKNQSKVSGLIRTHYRNGSFSHEEYDEEDEIDEVEHDLSDSETECESSVYDPSLPPGIKRHINILHRNFLIC